MQVTTHGLPKIAALIDCTGSGDVPCTVVVEPTVHTAADGTSVRTLKGLSGRTLTLGNWPCPSNKFRLGIKHSAYLFPATLVARLQKLTPDSLSSSRNPSPGYKERKEKLAIAQHALVTEAETDALALDASADKSDDAVLAKADRKDRLDALKDMFKNYEDPGIIADCVVFHDGNTWRAAIDFSETGDLTAATPLASYSEEHQFLRLGDDSMLNYSVNIYDDGEMLSIVTLAGSHGTHVAAITAAHYPEDPQLNGVAPGAQIVSLKIGDTRLGSMETGAGLTRAAIELARLNIDLANISYGEAAAIPNVGRFIELLKDDVINKKGCIVVASGGNEGPALTTVGAPGGTASAVIGVGAYVSHSMMDAEYAMLDKVQERPYTWSSRGPTLDGDLGVDIFAPGAAITSVPQYTIQRSQLMNGTSMSSPNCCGCLALLVSALKASSIPYSPYLVKAAIQATGKSIGDPFDIRFVQVEKAWKFLSETAKGYVPSSLFYDISVLNRDNARGVYLRDVVETSEVQHLTVQVNPIFPRKDEPSQNHAKLAMEVRVVLRSSERWISTPDFLLFNSSGRSFNILVDPSNLKPGLHYGTITGHDSDRPDIGPLFKIPITVCKPDQVASAPSEAPCYVKYESLRFGPGDIHRRFVHVPLGANFAELTVRSESRQTPARFIVHMLQLHPQTRYAKLEREFAFSLNSPGSGVAGEESVYKKDFAVLPNATIEVCLAQFWSSLDPSTVSVELKFHGLLASFSGTANAGTSVTLGSGGDLQYINPGSHGFTRVDVAAPVRNEELVPSVSLDTLRKTIRPASATISPLKSRDVLPDSRQLHQLVLTFPIKLQEGTSITPRFPRMNDMLYDSSIENFGLYIFDANKKPVMFRDIYAKPVKVAEGTYAVHVQVVSRSLDVLDKLQTMPLVLDASVSKSVSLPLYATLADCISGGAGTFKRKSLARGQRTVFWIGDAAASALPKDAKPGDLLIGKMDVTSAKVDGTLNGVAYIVPPEAKKDTSAEVSLAGEKEEPKPEGVQVKEAVRDLEISWLKKLTSDAERDYLLAKLEAEYPTHLPLLKQKLELLMDRADKTPAGESVAETLSASIVEAANRILHIIDESQVARYFGVQHDVALGGEKQRAEKKEMESQRELVAYAYRSKATAYRNLYDAGVKAGTDTAEILPLFDAALAKHAQWISAPPTNDGHYLLLWAWRGRLRGHYGTVLKHLNKYIGEAKNAANEESAKGPWKAALEMRAAVLNELGWTLWVEYEAKWKALKFPASHASF
nr:tripeptidyl-peptidase II Tpp2 [Polyrhizophydium stewartii]